VKYSKKRLLLIADIIIQNKKISLDNLDYISSFERSTTENTFFKLLKRSAVPLSLLFGFLFTAYPTWVSKIVDDLPFWTNMNVAILTGVDYLWDIIGEPVRKENVVYHIPNIILYSFGIFGIKKLFDALDKRTWLDKVVKSKEVLIDQIKHGNLNVLLKKGHSILFVGNGDFIGMQFVLNHKKEDVITISEKKPQYTDIWNYYNAGTSYEDLKTVIERASGENNGEYIFFPVKDDQIFLPSPTAYDLSPHKLDILCQNIRTIEKENRWKPKRIFIVGDKYHKSFVQSEDQKRVLKNTEDIISLDSISKKYSFISLIDPTEIVLKKTLQIANGRRIVFRATKEGIKEYKERFYSRLRKMGYKTKASKKGILTIGYDLFEDQTEQQTLSRTIDDYFPVVLSKNVKDALIRNGYKEGEFLYVPELVLELLSRKAAEQ